MTDQTPELQPWDKQKNEPTASYALFNEYLELGPLRTIPKVREKVKKSEEFDTTPSISTLENKSSNWQWKKRAEAYDLNQIEERRQETQQAYLRRTMDRIEENQEEEKALHTKIMEALNDPEFNQDLSKNAYGVRELSTAKNNVTQSQRLDLGEPTIIQRTDIDAKVKEENNQQDEVKDLFKEAEKGNVDEGADL